LNFLRRNGLKKGDGIFVILPLLTEIWLSYVTSIKGGFILIPAATILTVKDLEYRFKQFPPKVIIADKESALKIDQAEKKQELSLL